MSSLQASWATYSNGTTSRLFGVLAPFIAAHFFPSADPLAALINSYAVFAIGFLARPLGGLIFGQIGDRLGRRQALVLSVALMAVPTFLMGLLPTYQSVGIWAPILLIILRLVQGISAGGEFSGSIIFLVEQAPDHRRGLYGSIANFGAMIGGLLGAACRLVHGRDPHAGSDAGVGLAHPVPDRNPGRPLRAVGSHRSARYADIRGARCHRGIGTAAASNGAAP